MGYVDNNWFPVPYIGNLSMIFLLVLHVESRHMSAQIAMTKTQPEHFRIARLYKYILCRRLFQAMKYDNPKCVSSVYRTVLFYCFCIFKSIALLSFHVNFFSPSSSRCREELIEPLSLQDGRQASQSLRRYLN